MKIRVFKKSGGEIRNITAINFVSRIISYDGRNTVNNKISLDDVYMMLDTDYLWEY